MADHAPYAYFEDVNWGLLRLWAGRTGASILDVGCGFATTSQRLGRLGNRVTGIESSAVAVATAAGRIDEVIQADLQNTDEIARRLGDRRFDVVMFADVLEHVAWPLPVLQAYLPFVAAGGSVIVSLPNVGLWSTRFGLLAGQFEYADTGVLDRTHLRFFTRRSARRMIEDAGLGITRCVYTPGLVRPFVPLVKTLLARGGGGGGGASADAASARAPGAAAPAHNPAALLESAPYRAYLATIYPIERVISALWPGLLAFQMIFEARVP